MIIIIMILNSSYKKDITWIAKSVFTLIHIPKMQSSWIESGSVVVNNKKADPNPPQYLLCGWCLSISELRSLIWFSTELTLYICYDSKILAPALLNFCKLVFGSFTHCSRISCYPSFISQDFFHFSSFIHNGDNLNM